MGCNRVSKTPFRDMKLGIFPRPRDCMGGSSEFFVVPGPLYGEKGIYDESHLASLFYVPEPI